MSEDNNREDIKYLLHIMKALGWYIQLHRGNIKKKDIAKKLHLDPSVISYSIINPKNANIINENNYEESGKRIISIPRAKQICECMNTTLENVLYYYQFKSTLVNMTKIDKLENLTNNLTNKQELSNEMINDFVTPIWEQINPTVHLQNQVNNLISNANHSDFKPWIGRFYCYFSSTSSDEIDEKRKICFPKNIDNPELKELFACTTSDHIFCGIMDVYNKASKDSLCHVDFKFLANPEKLFIKKYSGILTLSAVTKAVFCELASQEQGEKSYIIFEKQDLGKGQPHVGCCMAMVLTYSSKVYRRRPCCERMILSSDIIKEGTDEYETMKAYLRMNDKMIRITQWGYNELLKDIKLSTDNELKEIIEKFPDLKSLGGQNVTIENCAFIPESMIRTLHSLTPMQKQKFEVLLRKHSIAPWYSKTKADKAETLFKLVNER